MSRASRKQSTKPVIIAAENSSHMLLAGVICLVVGLAVGYYFGKQSAEGQGVDQSQAQDRVPVGNPSNFLREEAALKSALLVDPKDLNALIQLGNLYYDHRQFQEAVEYYGRVLDINPRNPNVRTDRGTSFWNIGLPDAAIIEFKKSLEVDPSHAQTLYNLGLVYLNGKNNHEEARNAWERLLASNRNYPERTKVEQQLTSLQPAESGSAGEGKEPASNIQDLLQRLKKN